MKYEEDLVNNKELEDGKFEDATKEILEAVSGDSNIDYDEEMEPVAAIPTHLADFITLMIMIFIGFYDRC